MIRIPDTIYEGAMSLPPESRAALAEELWLSLEEKDLDEIFAGWQKEVERRVQTYQEGQATSVSRHEVMQSIRTRSGK
jgi:putative addiction module component (TIGR02574 family)